MKLTIYRQKVNPGKEFAAILGEIVTNWIFPYIVQEIVAPGGPPHSIMM